MVNVVWVSRHLDRAEPYPVAQRGYFDQGSLEALFAGTLWHSPGLPEFSHRMNFDGLEAGQGAIVVVPARHHASRSDMDWLNDQIRSLPWVLLVLTGDEEGVFPRHEVEHPRLAIWVQTPKADPARDLSNRRQRAIGDGWPPQCPALLATQPIEKPLGWWFAGQITHPERRACQGALNVRHATHGDGVAIYTQGFTQGMPPDLYYQGLASAKIAPCPGGPETPDTFRLFEALEAGCVPVVLRHPYWATLFGPDCPLVQIPDWTQFSGTADDILAEWPANANRIQAWWMARKRQMAENLLADLATLGAPLETPADPDDRITVLIPTSVIPSHPSTAIIEETVASVRAQLPRAEILVLVDGLPSGAEGRRADYEEYTRRLLFLAARRWSNVLVVLAPSHVHQSGLMRLALPMVRTGHILFVEHDTPLVGTIDWAGILAASESASVVRFHHEAAIHPEHRHLMLDAEPQMVGPAGVPMLRTAQWSARPHLATTDFYRWAMRRWFRPGDATFTEDVLNGVLESAFFAHGPVAWEMWKLWIYAPPGEGPMGGLKRSWHTDGRQGSAKQGNVFAWVGDPPPGAPSNPLPEAVSP